jgi:gliding motility-associated-like protein
VKDNLDIEKLFKEKFENFQGNVNPSLWNSISQGVEANTATSAGIGVGIKSLLIGSVVTVIGATTYLLGGFDTTKNITVQGDNTIKTEINIDGEHRINLEEAPLVIIADENDPVITENEAEIIEELNNNAVVHNETKHTTELVDISIESSYNSQENTESGTKKEATNPISIDAKRDNKQIPNNEEVNNVEKREEKPQIVYPSGRLNALVTHNIYNYNFESNALNAVKIGWNFGDGQFSKLENPTHVYSEPGEYVVTLTLTSSDNEVYEETKVVEIETSASIDKIPNVITPNGDRINDQLIIKTDQIESFNIVITDQFGNKVYESNNPYFSWDGTDMNGDIVEKSVYVYFINATGYDGTTFKIPGQIYVR